MNMQFLCAYSTNDLWQIQPVSKEDTSVQKPHFILWKYSKIQLYSNVDFHQFLGGSPRTRRTPTQSGALSSPPQFSSRWRQCFHRLRKESCYQLNFIGHRTYGFAAYRLSAARALLQSHSHGRLMHLYMPLPVINNESRIDPTILPSSITLHNFWRVGRITSSAKESKDCHQKINSRQKKNKEIYKSCGPPKKVKLLICFRLCLAYNLHQKSVYIVSRTHVNNSNCIICVTMTTLSFSFHTKIKSKSSWFIRSDWCFYI